MKYFGSNVSTEEDPRYDFDEFDSNLDHINQVYSFKNFSYYNIICNFERAFSYCEPKTINTGVFKKYSLGYDDAYRYLLFEVITELFLMPICCAIALIVNMLSIIVFIKNRNQDLKEKIFKYALISFIFNLIYCVNCLLKLVNICIERFSIYCPEYVTLIPMQLFDIYAIKLLLPVIRYNCIISELAISVSRFILVTETQLFFKYLNEIKTSYYLIVLIVSGVLLNLIKVFQYSVNRTYTFDSFPYYSGDHNNQTDIYRFPLTIINLTLFVITFLFPMIGISAFDILLLLDIKKKDKIKIDFAITNEKSSTKIEKKISECRSREERVTNLIVFNTIFMIISRIPEIVFNGLAMKTFFEKQINAFTEKDISYYFDMSRLLEYSDFFFTINGIFQFIIFYNFNRNFKESFNKIFLNNKEKPEAI